MTTHTDLAEELERVPRVLLDADEQKVVDDGLHALSAIGRESSRASTVCIVGPSGAGKSWLVNAIVGEEVSVTGTLRPTTTEPLRTTIEVAGDRVELCDTPAWEHQSEVVAGELTNASAAVVVVTPTRYADASVADLMSEVSGAGAVSVVLNTHGGAIDSGLVADARRVLGADVEVVAHESDAVDVLARVDFSGGDVAPLVPVLAAGAAGAGRFVASTVTERSTALGRLESAVERATIPERDAPLSVLETWRPTADAIVSAVSGLRDAVDHEIGLEADSDLHERFLETLPVWDVRVFAAELDEWRLETEAAFIARARIRWRKKSTQQLIRSTAWKSSVNPAVPLNRRVARALGEHRSEIVLMRFDALTDLMKQAASARRDEWRAAIDEVAGYTPGALLGAVERFESGIAG